MVRVPRGDEKFQTLGAWVGGLSTGLIAALLPSFWWWRACAGVPGWWPRLTHSILVIFLLLALALLGAMAGRLLAATLIRSSWWSFPFLAFVPGLWLACASAAALALGVFASDLRLGVAPMKVLQEGAVAWLVFSFYGFFIGLPWGWLTSLVIRLMGRRFWKGV